MSLIRKHLGRDEIFASHNTAIDLPSLFSLCCPYRKPVSFVKTLEQLHCTRPLCILFISNVLLILATHRVFAFLAEQKRAARLIVLWKKIGWHGSRLPLRRHQTHREIALKFLADRFTRGMCESQYGHGIMTIAVRGGWA